MPKRKSTDQSWPDLIAAHTSHVRQVALSYTRDWQDALDLGQHCLLKAILNERNFDKTGNLKGWLATMVRNEFINFYRKEIRFQKSDVASDLLYADYSGIQSVSNPGQYALDESVIESAISKLPPKLLPILRLRMQGYKYEEIAAELGMKLGSVRSKLRDARLLVEPLFGLDKPLIKPGVAGQHITLDNQHIK